MLCKALLTVFFIGLFTQKSFAEDYYVKLIQEDEDGVLGRSCLILSEETIQRFKGYKDNNPKALYVSSKPSVSAPGDANIRNIPNSGDRLIEIFAKNKDVLLAHVDFLCKATTRLPPLKLKQSKKPEILKLVDSGNQKNRIDVVFMGDGYQASERDEFFEDMYRLTRDMFQGETFSSYLPVFNIWAIFVESVDSGIGYNGPLNTPFELYREAGQLRGIYPGNPNYARQICRLTGLSGCDYPSLIGNDDYYGGLGGEFVISTRSNRTGTVVLRHEMGHNFVEVGEEYDNGYVYSGVNSARSVETLGWTHWLSGEKKEERAIYRLNKYPWKDLADGGVEFNFRSDGQYARWYLIVSVSAAGEADSLEFQLDGQILPWKSSGFDDREFYTWHGDEGFSAGTHTFSVRSKTTPTNPKVPRMICSINLHEYGTEEEFHADNAYVSAYPTWSAFGTKTFRPTNEGCLMRNMSHASLCNICKEGMWYQFFQRISIIDDVLVEPEGTPDLNRVYVQTLALGQLRKTPPTVAGEKLEVHWYLNGVEQESLQNKFEITAVTGSGSWTVSVTFITPEVRSDPTGLLSDSKSFTV